MSDTIDLDMKILGQDLVWAGSNREAESTMNDTSHSPFSSAATSISALSSQKIRLQHEESVQFLNVDADLVHSLLLSWESFVHDTRNGTITAADMLVQFLSYVVQRYPEQTEESIRIMALLVKAIEVQYGDDDIHAPLADLNSLSEESQLAGLSAYYLARFMSGGLKPACSRQAALLEAARSGTATVFALFGGQGVTSDPLEELRKLYTVYRPLIGTFIYQNSTYLGKILLDNPQFATYFPDGLDILTWIVDPGRQPQTDQLIRAPLSFPLIGLVQLANYALLIKLLGISPGQMRTFLSGIAGHSQGIITAVVASLVDDDNDRLSLERLSYDALNILFYIGCRSQECFVAPGVSPRALKDSQDHGEGTPSSMLSVKGMSPKAIQLIATEVNTHLSRHERVELALINGPKHVVLGGYPSSLYCVCRSLRLIKSSGVSQSRIPFSQRKPDISLSYLPVTAPFHTSHLQGACDLVLQDVQNLRFERRDMKMPIYDTTDGSDMAAKQDNEDLIPDLVKMVLTKRLDWPQTVRIPNATHILDLGPGLKFEGIGALTDRLKHGLGVRTIVFSMLKSSSPEIGDRAELLDRRRVVENTSWQYQYAPKLEYFSSGTTSIQTKLTRLLNLPPIMVAGMTPTTSNWPFVVATMNAGYHIELAAGGFHESTGLEAAIRSVVSNAPAGRGVTCNVIYANPRALNWQLALIRKLQNQALPIEGLTIGGGVPSPEVASSYIRDWDFKHISFKPGSVNAIKQVIQISKLNPGFPIILQWTGGRAGGHHSFEDFHEPLLQTYSQIRACSNIILVAGGGFGNAEDSYPYLSGKWSIHYGNAPMPVDGILLGSRVMVAREARTSPEAKALIAQVPGVSDAQWEETYQNPAGGIISVISEMGEPIHKIATRAVRLWSELDKTVFIHSDKRKQLEILKQRKDRIISKLNSDYSKVWFGHAQGRA
ncbi:hypothetical protein IL306_014601, partial [Fusarium sp. DS 682]